MPVAGFVPDSATGIDAFINEGVQRLHEMLVEAYDSDYFSTTQSFTTPGGETVGLPSNFYKLLGVDIIDGDITRTILPYARGMRNVYKNSVLGSPWAMRTRYRLEGPNTLRFLPAPPAGTQGVIRYVPVATTLVLPADTVDFPNGWERYVVLYTAIQMKMKQEDSITDLRAELEKMETELRMLADRRDLASPAHAVDMDAVNEADLRWWLP